ncbi:MAG: dehypoxanthine futalosine cyclase [Candidatus Omnitrophica bacterium]|nr:dehypoxanthine futalosine cyclase [Candidatus Omnitrophota bacterium]
MSAGGAVNDLLAKGADDGRLTAAEALRLWEEADLVALGRTADTVRLRLHPDNLGTFVVDRNINYTNACVADCSFCAFYRKPGHPEAYVLPVPEVLRRVGELVEIGGTQVLLQGGLDPSIPLSFYEELCRAIKRAYPQIHLHSFSAPEIDTIAQATGLSYAKVFERLKAAGLDSMPGGGAEILSERVRQAVSPKKLSAAGWFAVHRAAHEAGLKTTCTMTYGMVETPAERVEHLIALRDLQDQTGGFRAFIPWSFQRGHTVLNTPPAGGMEYLRIIALSRLVLDNVPNVQAGWVTEGPKLAQIALSFGANDFGGILVDEVVVGATGMVYRVDKEEALRLIRGAGRTPAQRNTKYEILRVFPSSLRGSPEGTTEAISLSADEIASPLRGSQ